MSRYILAVRSHVRTLTFAFSMFTAKAWIITSLVAAIGLALIGLTTAIFENWFFIRMTPVRSQDYVIWVVSSVFIGPDRWELFCGQIDRRRGKGRVRRSAISTRCGMPYL